MFVTNLDQLLTFIADLRQLDAAADAAEFGGRDLPHSLTRNFHLFRCVCGAPSYQQPCPSCGYYPMAGDPSCRETARCKGTAVQAHWTSAVERAGGIAAWYLSNYRRTQAWSTVPGFQARIAALIERAPVCPVPLDAVWELVASGELEAAVKAEYERARAARDLARK
jgi:hypothetical protein